MSKKYFEITLNIVGTEDGDLAYSTKELETVLKDHLNEFPQAELEAIIVEEVSREYHEKQVIKTFNKSQKKK